MLAAEIADDSPDFGQLEPMMNATAGELERAGITGAPEVVVATPATGTTSRWTASPPPASGC